MKIIILGAGQVGGSLAETLIHENHDITLVDVNEERLSHFSDRLDIQTITGHGSYPDVLSQAGAEDADMIIAVTDNDEANMVACQVVYSLFHVTTKIARVRSHHYFINQELFGKEDLPIDVFISPEQLVTEYVAQLVFHPGALQVLSFNDDLIKLVAMKPYYGGALVGKTIRALYDSLPDLEVRIIAIFRDHHSLSLQDDTKIQLDDELFFMAATEDINPIISSLRQTQNAYQRIMIAGGGNIGSRLASRLQDDYNVKLIDHNRQRCKKLAEKLTDVTVLNGEVSDEELLLNENIDNIDVFIAVTNDDEANILSCIQAKRLGAKYVMSLITRPAYVDLMTGGPINIAISPQEISIGSILAHIRAADVPTVHSLRRGMAEALEVIVHGDQKTSQLVGKPWKNVVLPKGVIIAAIIRERSVIITHHDTAIEAGDHIILFVTDKKKIRDVEKLFQVSSEFF